MSRMRVCFAVGRWLLSAVLVAMVAQAPVGVAAVEPSRLQADADGLMKNVEEMDLLERWKKGEFGSIELVRRLEAIEAAQRRSEAPSP